MIWHKVEFTSIQISSSIFFYWPYNLYATHWAHMIAREIWALPSGPEVADPIIRAGIYLVENDHHVGISERTALVESKDVRQ